MYVSLLVSICVIFAYSAEANRKDQACLQKCSCPKDYNPVCVNEDNSRKKINTFKNPCSWMCHARCKAPKSRFLYCGECDHRPLPKFGSEMDPKELWCLELQEDGKKWEAKYNKGKFASLPK